MDQSQPNPVRDGNGDDFVRATIDRLRLKLLDLATRNPLISFKHATRTRRYVRVIDELPNQLFQKLSSDSGMRFKSLGRETNEPEDEKTVQFRRALAAAKLEDPEYREKLEELGDDPAEKAVESLEQELRNRLRENLGMPQRRAQGGMAAADVARQLNLNPSFDLPTTPAGGTTEERYSDAYIQTLLFEDEMQLTLARMREAVRLSIDETGVNPLFCVFGFLEWYEDTNSQTALHSPLLLCPLQIERRLIRGQYQYIVQSTGEEIAVNVAIAERLKRDFEIVLPEYEEDETPESYLTSVQQVIDRMKGWKVRRWITVGLFSFARIAMYHDLAADRWKSVGGLDTHEGLSRLLGGGTADGNGEANVEEDTDTAALKELEIPLISDADSSQLQAVADALSGRSFVIEGPPGTGKSQTITNIIAAALAAGKTVLFVAEKMAALSVVRDRLQQAGLGDFCLELHSTKAGRKDTAIALAHRLKRPNHAAPNSDLQATLKRLQALSTSLERYVEALAQPAGKLGITNQELLWRCHIVRKQSEELPGEIDELVLPNAGDLTEIDVGHILSAVHEFEKARTRVIASYGSVGKHPWNGIASSSIHPIQAEDIVRRVKRLAEAAEWVARVLDKVQSLTQIIWTTPRELERFAAAAQIKPPGPLVDDRVVAALADSQQLAVMEDYSAKLNTYAEAAVTVLSAFESAEAANKCESSVLERVAEQSLVAGFGEFKIHEISSLVRKRQQQSVAWSSLKEFVESLAARTSWTSMLTSKSEQALGAAVDLASRANAEIFGMRIPPLLEPAAVTVLQSGAKACESLGQRKKELSETFELGGAPDPALLRDHAKALRAAPILPFLSPKWWRARRSFLAIAKRRDRVGRQEMARQFEELAKYIDDLRQFSTDGTILKCAGTLFKGVETDFAALLRVTSWAEEVRSQLPLGNPINSHLRKILFEGSWDELELLASASKDPQMPVFRKVFNVDPLPTSPVAVQASSSDRAMKAACEVGELTKTIGLNGNLSFSACGTVAANLKRMCGLQEFLDTSETAKLVLGDRFQGHATNKELIAASTKYVRELHDLELPSALQDWLLKSEIRHRVPASVALGDSAHQSITAFHAAVAELTRTVNVNFKKWLGHDVAMDMAASDLRDHAVQCANDAEGLQLLIDDCRTGKDVSDLEFQPLLDLLESHSVTVSNLSNAAKRVVYQSMAREAISQSPALASFSGDRHESSRKEFRELDHKLKRLRQSAIAATLAKRRVDSGINTGSRRQWTGLSLIQNEATKQKGYVSVRDLMDRAGTAVQQLMPCFMMSPLSVAQFLKPGKLRFDLLVIDEASQIRPEDAIGSIARCGQLVVVGDPKQLPPTNFFRESNSITDNEEGESAADEQSILDQALAIMHPARRLKWHYRSRHSSLIAFSNKEFYDSQLIVFPSPYHDHSDYGVSYVYVPDGVLRSRVNVPEAQAVAKSVIEYVGRHPERSVGIVTLNQPQAELLGHEIDRLATEHEEFEVWRQKKEQTLERFFVKNLENVQGDERDTIFISTVYGPDEPGVREFAQRFGPINNQGGHRRLNVLFTRAKYQTVIFSSMDPADIRTEATSAWGVRALKGYLKFAKSGVLDLPLDTGREPDSEFEVAVMSTLRGLGYEIVPQVGVVGYFIDLAVRHPDRLGEFALGIECDGANYHSSKSARDRDRLRQEILERLKWRIHRIWSLDWYRNSKRETERLVNAVREAISIPSDHPEP